jgi:hypothetical protein
MVLRDPAAVDFAAQWWWFPAQRKVELHDPALQPYPRARPAA